MRSPALCLAPACFCLLSLRQRRSCERRATVARPSRCVSRGLRPSRDGRKRSEHRKKPCDRRRQSAVLCRGAPAAPIRSGPQCFWRESAPSDAHSSHFECGLPFVGLAGRESVAPDQLRPLLYIVYAIPGVKTRASVALPLFSHGIPGFSRVAGPEYCWDKVATAARPRFPARPQRSCVFHRKTSKERLKTRFGAK